jgi:hypothetical protein
MAKQPAAAIAVHDFVREFLARVGEYQGQGGAPLLCAPVGRI